MKKSTYAKAKKSSRAILRKNIRATNLLFRKVPNGSKKYVAGTERFLIKDYEWTDAKRKPMSYLKSPGGI